MEKTPHHDQISENRTHEFLEKYGLQRIHFDLFDKTRFVITAGLGLIAALAWDDMLRTLFNEYFTTTESPLGKVAYALFLTVFAGVVGLVLSRLSKRRRKRKNRIQ